jgi:serine/threonine protein kinase
MVLHAQKEPLKTIGNWDVLEKIANSGIGTLYKARSCVDGDIVLLKVMPPFAAGNGQAYQRFARECRILSALNDPHIVRALDFGIEGSEPYLVMEFAEGENLAQRIEREGALPEAEAVRLISQVAGALGRAHQRGLVHRNVSPENILLTADGQTRLTGMDVVKEVEARDGLTRVGTFLGTPDFMAPEQFANASKATIACDVYSLGATLFMAVTGQAPFGDCRIADMWAKKLKSEPPSAKELVPTLSDAVDAAIRRAMNAKADCRHSSCAEFAEALKTGASDAGHANGHVRPTAKRRSDPVLPAEQPAPESSSTQSTPATLPPAPLLAALQPALQAAAPATVNEESDGTGWPVLLAVAAVTVASFLGGLYLLLHTA